MAESRPICKHTKQLCKANTVFHHSVRAVESLILSYDPAFDRLQTEL